MRRKLAFVLLALGFPVLSLAQSAVSAENVSKYIGNNRWEWTVFVRGDPGTLSQISCVQYELHPTFPNRIRRVCDRGPDPNRAFPLTASGWGTFNIPITITFADGHVETLSHDLHFDSAAPTPTPTPAARSARRLRRRPVAPARRATSPAATPTPSSSH